MLSGDTQAALSNERITVRDTTFQRSSLGVSSQMFRSAFRKVLSERCFRRLSLGRPTIVMYVIIACLLSGMCWERYIRGGIFGERYTRRLSLGRYFVIAICM